MRMRRTERTCPACLVSWTSHEAHCWSCGAEGEERSIMQDLLPLTTGKRGAPQPPETHYDPFGNSRYWQIP